MIRLFTKEKLRQGLEGKDIEGGTSDTETGGGEEMKRIISGSIKTENGRITMIGWNQKTEPA